MAETGREAWRKRVERWRDSGLTAREFATETGLNANTLQWWSSRLAREGGRKPAARRHRAWPKFIEVGGTAPSTGATLELVVSDTVVRVPAGFDEATLRRVLAVVRRP